MSNPSPYNIFQNDLTNDSFRHILSNYHYFYLEYVCEQNVSMLTVPSILQSSKNMIESNLFSAVWNNSMTKHDTVSKADFKHYPDHSIIFSLNHCLIDTKKLLTTDRLSNNCFVVRLIHRISHSITCITMAVI